MRSIWNGAISFGLVSIPIKLVNATESHNVSFRQIHTEDGGRIRYRKVCELDGEEVVPEEIGKGYEDADGSIIPITEDDLDRLPIPTAKTIEIVAFVPADRIDPLQMGTAYYLAPNGVPAAKPYTLLREALRRSRRVAIAKFALRGRERLGMLRVVDETIAMHGLLWPDEIRAPESAAPQTEVTVRDAELDLADALMDTLGEVDLDDLHDDYRDAVEELIAAKTAGEPVARPAAEGGGKVIDLMSALESSVRAAQEARGETPEAEAAAAGTGGGKAATPKSTAPKSARKPAAPRKSTAARKTAGTGKSTAGRTTKSAKSAKSADAGGTAKSAGTGKGAGTGSARGGTGGKSARGTRKTGTGPRRASA
ncbi:Ku protein [Streptomyces sp. NPDC058045]|uniref:non-homologous end joining protein Ku n=1 Tax=Streptomyces sp. NPDC058045 TaxID=3346311 RepID=UPI0036E157B4